MRERTGVGGESEGMGKTGRGKGRARAEVEERHEGGGGENRGLVTSPGSTQSQPSRTLQLYATSTW